MTILDGVAVADDYLRELRFGRDGRSRPKTSPQHRQPAPIATQKRHTATRAEHRVGMVDRLYQSPVFVCASR